MKVRLYFEPLDVEVPDSIVEDYSVRSREDTVVFDAESFIEEINENWETHVDPSEPVLATARPLWLTAKA